MAESDPALFYSAALNSATAGAATLHGYPLEWRTPMIANVSLTTLRFLLHNTYPTPVQRQRVIALFTLDYPNDEEIGPVVSGLIDAAFSPMVFANMMEHLAPEEFAVCALLIPPPIARRYPWKPGERHQYINYLCEFDQTAFTD